jgi:hypothetical protein
VRIWTHPVGTNCSMKYYTHHVLHDANPPVSKSPNSSSSG